MMTMEAQALQAGDVYTADDGETWRTVKVVRMARRGTRVVVIDTEGKEHVHASETTLVVRI